MLFVPHGDAPVHPTQKPVALCEYFIKTYTRPGEVVADICAGSGTTAVAALNTGRRFICFETAPAFYGRRHGAHPAGAGSLWPGAGKENDDYGTYEIHIYADPPWRYSAKKVQGRRKTITPP